MDRMSVEIHEREGLFVRQTLDLDDGTNFHSAPTAGRNASGDVDGFVKVLGVDQKEAAQLFARLRERAVSDHAFAVFNANAGGSGGRVKGRGTKKMTGFVKLGGVGGRVFVALIPLGLANGVFVEIDEQHIFHKNLSVVSRTANARIDSVP